MRNLYRRPRFAIALLTALAGTASFAHAEDVVVMPYRCAVVEGRPVLTPADETGHRVLGKLEKQKVKTCSTVDPKRCRQWATFKFDVDCGGTRVAWMQVFANASEHTRRRVWERNGRLRVQNTTQRSKRVDDMCARRMGVNQEWWSVNEICDEVSPLNAPTSTDMPAGFAPMVGLDAVFLPESAIAMPSARTVKAVPAPAARTETVSIQATPQAKPAEAAAVETVKSQRVRQAPDVAPVAAGDVAPVAVPPEAPAASVNEAALAEEQALPQQTMREAPIQAASPTNPLPVERVPPPRTENAMAAPAELATRDDVATRVAAREVRDEPAPVVEANTSAEPETAAPERAANPQMVMTATEPDGSKASNTLAYIIVSLASGFLLATLLVVKWLGRADTSETAPQDMSARHGIPPEFRPSVMADSVAVSSTPVETEELPDPSSGTALALAKHHVTAPAPIRRQPAQHVARPMTLGERMPSTKGEALALLGMGVASESNLGSLKKIIDGLRMNWHPDHAQDEADRRVRELRLKQINAAWDILGGKAAGA